MAVKLKHSSESLLNKQFPKKGVGGYDAFEVDSIYDEIIRDYRIIEKSHLLSDEEYKNLKNEIEKLRKENLDLKIKLDGEKGRNRYIKKDGSDIHEDNLVLLKRIGKLEYIIHEKLHLNPEEITNFDLDDC